MREDKLLTVREVSRELGIAEKEVIDLAEQGRIQAYKIGGLYLRFKPEHIQEIRQEISKTVRSQEKVGFFDRLQDFFYFSDFYILSILIIILMLILVFRV
ncbi:MAG: helix-turn-helix domain-containing protein [Candidatus Omnitrophica bacterium]|nr:helix-turn-helix domain-containing protein [Candidatus Omnitrophota bacterium]MBU1871396.1 helix-turn-helix domain-containing protein [Candidatus Omnitrophota bacterium]